MTDVITDMWRTGPPPKTGQRQRYPSRFWFNFEKVYPLEGAKVLHMFSGSMKRGDTTDIRPETKPTFIAPYDKLPIPDDTYDWVIADPPYSMGFFNEWTQHPRHLPIPKRILKEATRVTKPGGRVAILHIIVIRAYTRETKARRIALHGILCGENNAIRVLNVFEKIRL